MSRVITLLVILILMAVVALVPRLGTEEPGLDLGEGYTYREGTLVRFRLLLEDPGWSLADPPRNPQGMLEAVHAKTGLTFVLIPAGSFRMGMNGTATRHRDEDALPPHRVDVSPFLLCATECTWKAWRSVGLSAPSKLSSPLRRPVLSYPRQFPSAPQRPVEPLSWDRAKEWCSKADLRLPTEAEWEYTCRAGFEEDLLGDVSRFAWHAGNSTEGVAEGEGIPVLEYPYALGRSRQVGLKNANGWGAFDMLGNVWEWCEDTWHDSYVGAPTDGSAWTDGNSTNRVLRGGSWWLKADCCTPYYRLWTTDGRIRQESGIRPAADLPEVK